MRVGVDQTDITPERPVDLAGFAARAADGPARTVAAPLHVRSLALHTDTGSVVLVSADLLWWGHDTTDRLQAAFAERFGLPRQHLILHATHTHSGPQSSHRFTELLGPPDADYLQRLEELTLESVGRALAQQRLARIERASTRAALGVDRRAVRADGVTTASSGAPDDEITVLRIVTDTGTAALLVHYACHPVVHHANAVTSDFAGAAMSQLEAEGTAEISLYLQGSCGDVNPDRYNDEGAFQAGTQADVEAMGSALAAAVIALDRTGDWATSEAAVAVDESIVTLPLRDRPTPDELIRVQGADGVEGQWARLLLADRDRLTGPTTVRLTRLRLTASTTLLGLSAELVSHYGRYAKSITDHQMLIMGYTNGMTCYLVTDAQLAEGGYEPAGSPYYFGLPAPLAPGVETVLESAIADQVRQR